MRKQNRLQNAKELDPPPPFKIKVFFPTLKTLKTRQGRFFNWGDTKEVSPYTINTLSNGMRDDIVWITKNSST